MFQILLENRFKNAKPGQQSFMTIDGMDCAIPEFLYPFSAIWYSHKFNHAGVRYEIGICINTGDIVWISGPWPAGVRDCDIYNHGLSNLLLEHEWVEADSGYGQSQTAMTPNAGMDYDHRKQKSVAKAYHEIVNWQIKFFEGIMRRFRHRDHSKHRAMFIAVAVITQIGFNNGKGIPFAYQGIGNYPNLPIPEIPDNL